MHKRIDGYIRALMSNKLDEYYAARNKRREYLNRYLNKKKEKEAKEKIGEVR